MKTFWKGLVMALVGFLASTISDLEVINWAYVLITTIGFTAVYIGKNYWKPSTSDANNLNPGDLWSGILIAVGMGVSSFAASIITTGMVDWKALGIAVISAVVGYFSKTFISKPKKE